MDFFRLLTAGTRLSGSATRKNNKFSGSKQEEAQKSKNDENGESAKQSKKGTAVDVYQGSGGGVVDEMTRPSNFADEKAVHSFRKAKRINIHRHFGETELPGKFADIPPPIQTFEELCDDAHASNWGGLAVPRWLVHNVIENCGFKIPTSVQLQAIPCILRGQPLLCSAPTGSGKTLAYLLPAIALMKAPGRQFIRTLVVCPSRELGHQIHRQFKALTAGKKFRSRMLSKALAAEVEKGRHRIDFVVTTPLIAVQMCREDKVSLKDVKHLIIDEADKLLDLGFAPQLDEIFSYCTNPLIQKLFFSATLPENVVELVDSVLHCASRISVGAVGAAASDIEQRLVFVTDEHGKLPALRQLLRDGYIKPPTLIFVQSKQRADELFAELAYDGLFVDVMHGDKSAAQRATTIRSFRAQKIWILLCTDLLARGIDFKGVKVVVNFDFPQSASDYIHRIGRTGRAGNKGEAMTFFTIEDVPNLRVIAGVMRQSGCDVPDWILEMKKKRSAEKRMLQRRPPKRQRTATRIPTSGKERKQMNRKKSANATNVPPCGNALENLTAKEKKVVAGTSVEGVND